MILFNYIIKNLVVLVKDFVFLLLLLTPFFRPKVSHKLKIFNFLFKNLNIQLYRAIAEILQIS